MRETKKHSLKRPETIMAVEQVGPWAPGRPWLPCLSEGAAIAHGARVRARRALALAALQLQRGQSQHPPYKATDDLEGLDPDRDDRAGKVPHAGAQAHRLLQF